VSIQKGDEALTERGEKNIPSRRIPPDPNDKTIYFKGKYILIVNETTNDQKAFKEKVAEYTDFEIPAGYTCYVRGASFYFKD
jgi:hypothetical protein